MDGPEPNLDADIRRVDIGGVPVLWAEAPPPFTVALDFRVGTADETLPRLGVTHLIEHLAIFGAGPVDHPYNGSVGWTSTAFWASGTREEALGFVQRVAARLHDLPYDRLPGERRILRTEEQPNTVNERLCQMRYGAANFGLWSFTQFGLRWLGPEELEAWSLRFFTADNVAVTMTGPPPDDWDLRLPPGAAQPDPSPVSLLPVTPVHVAQGSGGVALSLQAPRSALLNASVQILENRVTDVLRRDAALAYSPYARYDSMRADQVLVTIGSDCDDRHARDVQDRLWAVVGEYAQDGPRPEEVELFLRRGREFFADPQSVRSQLGAAADRAIRGLAPRPPREWMDEVAGASAEAFAAEVRDALSSALMLASDGVPPPPGEWATELRTEAPPAPPGGKLHRVRRSGLRRPSSATVRVGDSFFEHRSASGEITTLTEPEVVLGVWFPEGSGLAMARDGSWVRVSPLTWDDGEAVVAGLTALAAGRMVPSGPLAITDALREASHAAGIAGRPALTDPLRDLSDVLDDDEGLTALAAADRGSVAGVLAVTGRRVVWLPNGDVAFELVSLDDVRDVSGRGKTTVTCRDGSAETFAIASAGREAAVAAIRALVRDADRS